MEIQATFLKNLLDYSSYQNLDTSALIGFINDRNINLEDSSATVNAEDYIKVFQKVIESSDNYCSGLKMGSYLNLSSLGLVLNISLSTSSLKQGIYILENYLNSKFPIVSINTSKDTDYFIINLMSSLENEEIKEQLLNMVISVIYRELKLMLPKQTKIKVSLPFSRNEDVSLFFSDTVTFSKSHKIILPKEVEGIEINVNRIREVELLLPKFLSMINHKTTNSKRFSKKVRNMILNMCNPEIPNLKQVQKQFAFSERTFQRRLSDEGNSFRKITNEIKKELSNYLSNEKHLMTKDIAYILGYTDSSAYLHAAKAWKIN